MANSGLIIRRNERYEVSIPIRARVSYAHAEAVKLHKGRTDEKGWIGVHLIDFSIAGVGIVSETFFPRGATLEIDIPSMVDGEQSLFTGEVRVMRVQMTDRRPAYLIGCAFKSESEETREKVNAIMDILSGAEDA